MSDNVEIHDGLQAMFNQQLAEAETPITLAATTIPVDVRGKYVFRSDPGYRQPCIRIPGVPTAYMNEQDRAYMLRKFEAKHGKTQAKRFERIAEKVGDLTITFTPIHNKQEAYFVTDEIEVAEFIRGKMADGTCPYIYEDDAMLTVEEQTMPTHRAQAAMRLKQAKQKQEA